MACVANLGAAVVNKTMLLGNGRDPQAALTLCDGHSEGFEI